MSFALSDEQLMLRDSVRGLLSRRAGDPDLWSVLCSDIGIAGLAIPEEYGGAGATAVETHVVAEELGRVLAPCPLLGSAVLAGRAVLATGDREACARLLPGIADGTSIATLAIADQHWDAGNPAFVARPASGGWTIDGTAHYVLDGDIADVLLVAARTEDGAGLFEVDLAGVRREHTVGMDLTRRLATVQCTGTAGRRIGDAEAVRTALRLATVALSAEQVGAAAHCLDATVEYTKTRQQFGRAIGGFQALKHRMADLFVLVETARSASYAAVAADDGDQAVRAAVAKAYCSEAFSAVAAEMIQLHGGIAITWEHEAHRYFKRAHGSAQLFGAPGEHLNHLGELVGINH